MSGREHSGVLRDRDFKPVRHIHLHLGEGVTPCGAPFGVPVSPWWPDVTCPRCHAAGIADAGVVEHHARVVVASSAPMSS